MKKMNIISKYKASGFTLMEVLIATVLIGIAVAAILATSRTLTAANGEGIEMTRGEFLLEQVREYTTTVGYDSLSALDGQSYNPPIDADGQLLVDFQQYTQQLVVTTLNDDDLTAADPNGHFKRIDASVNFNGQSIARGSWVRADY
jgi:prepilin-type N-terminal cleavage/methylation domain-containing protein